MILIPGHIDAMDYEMKNSRNDDGLCPFLFGLRQARWWQRRNLCLPPHIHWKVLDIEMMFVWVRLAALRLGEGA